MNVFILTSRSGLDGMMYVAGILGRMERTKIMNDMYTGEVAVSL